MNQDNLKKYSVVTTIIVVSTYIILIPLLGFIIKTNTPLCIFSNIFHIKCWGCGMTRAFYSFLTFNYIKGIAYNSLIIIVFPLTFTIYFRHIYSIVKKGVFKRENK